MDIEYIRRESVFGTRVAPGVLTFALAEGLTLQTGILHGTGLALLSYDVRVLAPVLAGDTISVEIEVVDRRETRKPDRGVVTFRHRIANQRGRGGHGGDDRPHDQAAGRVTVAGARPARTADVVIVGGGVTGCSIAFHLAERASGTSSSSSGASWRPAAPAGPSGSCASSIRPTRARAWCSTRCGSSRASARSPGATPGTCSAAPCSRSGAGQRDGAGAHGGGAARARHRHPADRARTTSASSSRGSTPSPSAPRCGSPSRGTATRPGSPPGSPARPRARASAIEQGAEVVALDVARDGDRGSPARRAATGSRRESVVNAAGLWSPAVAALAGVTLPIVVGRHPVFVVQRAPEFGRPHPVYLDLASGTFLRPETGGLTLTGFLDADEPNHPLDPEALGSDVGLRRGRPDHGAGEPLHPGPRGGALPARLCGGLRHHAGLDADPRRDPGPRPLRRRRDVGPRLQAVARRSAG